MNKYLVYNAIQTPDGTILNSKYGHDYQSHIDANGETYFTDGGTEYQRISVNNEPAKILSLYNNDDFELIRQKVTRGTFNSKGNRIFVPICQLSNNHLINILTDTLVENRLSSYDFLIMRELIYRDFHGIVIEDTFYD